MAKLSNSPKQTLNFDLERRKSFTFRTRLRHKDGTLVDLTGCTLRFVMKQQGSEEDPFDLDNLIVNHEANIGDGPSGEALFAFQAAELDGDPGEYDYSIVLWTPDDYSTLLCKGVINLVGNSESHSMHRMYGAMRPGSTVDLQIRSDDVVEITAGETVQLVTEHLDATSAGRALLTAADAGAQRSAMGAQRAHMIDVRDYGAKGDGVTDDTAAIQAALDAAPDGGRLWFPPGSYRTTAPITITRQVSVVMAGRITADHSGTALKLSGLGLSTYYQGVHTINVTRTTVNHADTDSVGLEISGCYNQTVTVLHASKFTVGVLLTAPFGRGCVYNQVYLQALKDNLVAVRLKGLRTGPTDPESQWPNQNTFIGGRISWGLGTSDRTNARGIQVGTSATGEYLPNGNVFINMSIEDVGSGGVFATPVECYGNNNTFIATRMEGGLNPTFRSSSSYNRWIGSFYGALSNVVDEGTQNSFDMSLGGKAWSTATSPRTFGGAGAAGAGISVYNRNSDSYNAIEFLAADGITPRGGITAGGRITLGLLGLSHVVGSLNAAPTSGTWKRGDVAWNVYPSASGFVGWVCVAAGTPGTWKGFGSIEA